MATYRLTFTTDAVNLPQIQKKVKDTFGVDLTPQIEKISRNPDRTEQFGEAEALFERAKEMVSDIKSDVEEAIENIPENLKGGERAENLNTLSQELEELNDRLEEVDFSSVNIL